MIKRKGASDFRLAPFFSLFFFSITQIACISQSRHDIGMSIQFRVDGAAPHGGFFSREYFFDMLDGLTTGNDRSNVYMRWFSFG